MKIAVMSDIHGNKEALDAVLEDIKNRECDMFFILGDYAMAGPEPALVVDFFMQKKDNSQYKMIQGNTDLMIADYSEELFQDLYNKAPVMANALRNDVSTLDVFQKKFLKTLPAQLEVDIDGVKFLLVHGSTRKNNEDILPTTPMEEVEKMLDNVDADVILCGHTHLPCGFQTSKKKTVVNVGSVGRPFTPEAKSCYLTITVENKKCLFEHHFVEYDNILASKKVEKRNFWGADKLAMTLLDPQKRHF